MKFQAILMRTFTDAPGKLFALGIFFWAQVLPKTASLHDKSKKTDSQVEIFHTLGPFNLNFPRTCWSIYKILIAKPLS